MSMMSQPSLNTNPLFPTSLRRWQAAWRAEKGLSDGETERPTVAVRPQRFKRRNRRAAEKPAAQ
jgi:hypothetical protein